MADSKSFEILKNQGEIVRSLDKEAIVETLKIQDDLAIQNLGKRLERNISKRSVESLIAIGVLATAGVLIKKHLDDKASFHINELTEAVSGEEDPSYDWRQRTQRAVADLQSSNVVGRNNRRSSFARIILGKLPRKPSAKKVVNKNTLIDLPNSSPLTPITAQIEPTRGERSDAKFEVIEDASNSGVAKKLVPKRK